MPYRRKCRSDGMTMQKARVENVFNSLLPSDASRFTDGCRGPHAEGVGQQAVRPITTCTIVRQPSQAQLD
jgi:hypothetical protein